jgi:hypothetical protein
VRDGRLDAAAGAGGRKLRHVAPVGSVAEIGVACAGLTGLIPWNPQPSSSCGDGLAADSVNLCSGCRTWKRSYD